MGVFDGLVVNKMQLRFFLFVFTAAFSVWVPKQHRWISQGQNDDPAGPQTNVKHYLGRFPRDDQMQEDQVPPVRVQDQLPGLQRVGEKQSSCISALLEGLNYLATMRDPMGQPLPPKLYDQMGQPLPPKLYDRTGQAGQQLIEEPRAEAATDRRSELSRLLGSSSSSNLPGTGSSSNLLKRPSSNPLETSSNPLESDNEEDEGMTVEIKQSKRPTLWRYKPAKRAGGWGNLFFTLLGEKEGQMKWKVPNKADYDYHFQSRIGKSMPGNKDLNQETVPNIGDYYDSRIRKKENDRTMIRLPWQMGIFSPRLSKRTAA